MLNSNSKLRLVCCLSIKSLLSSLKSCNCLVYFLLRSVWILRKLVCLLYSVVVCFALFFFRVLVGWVGFSYICTRVSLASLYLTMLSNSSIKLILVGGVLIKLLTCSIKLSLSIVNSLLRGVGILVYFLSCSKCLIISCFSCACSLILLSIRSFSVILQEGRLSHILILISFIRAACSCIVLLRITLIFNVLLKFALVSLSTIKSLASLIQPNRCVIDTCFKLFRQLGILRITSFLQRIISFLQRIIIRSLLIVRCIVVLMLSRNILAINLSCRVLVNRLLQILYLMIRLRHKDNVNCLRRIPRLIAIFDVNVSVHRQSIRQNKQTRFIYLVSFSSNYYRLSVFIPRIRTSIRLFITEIHARIRNILTIFPVSAVHIAERQLSCRLIILKRVAHMRLLIFSIGAFMVNLLAASKVTQARVRILWRSFQQTKNLICIKLLCRSWIVTVDNSLMIFAPG